MDSLDPSFTVASPMTLEEVIGRLGTLPETRATRRRDLISAVRTVARFAGTMPAVIRVDVPALRKILDNVQPARFRMTARRLSNVRSLFVRALVLAGTDVEPLRLEVPLTDDWARVRALLPAPEQRTIARFAQHCSALAIAPAAVTDAVVAAYEENLLARTFVREPRAHVLALTRCWNQARDRYAGWPAIRLTRVSGREIVTLPLEHFSAGFKADLEAWLDRLAGTDPLADTPFKPARPSTLASRRATLLRCASILVREGWDPTRLTSLGALIEVDAARVILRWHLARSGGRASWYTESVASVLLALARHWHPVEPDRLERLKWMTRRCRVTDKGMTTKNRDLLRLFEDERQVVALLDLPDRLMRRFERQATMGPRELRLAAVAAALAILICAPIRMENLHRIELDRHLVRYGAGRRREVRLRLPGHEVKNERSIELPLSNEATRLLDRYLKRAWPATAAPGCTYLFPGRGGGPRSKNGFGTAITRTVERELGVRVTPHQFRHLTGFLYLQRFPGEYETVRALLGHRQLQTTIQFYAGLESLEAGRRFDAVVLEPRRRRAS